MKVRYNGLVKMNFGQEKSVKSQGISFQTKSGYPVHLSAYFAIS